MNHVIIPSVIVLLMGLSHYGFAQGSGSSSRSSSRLSNGTVGSYTNPGTPAYNPEGSDYYNPDQNPHQVTRTVKGSLVSVDTEFLILKTKKNKLVTLKLTPDTNYKRRKNKTVFQELSTGQAVKVTCKPAKSALLMDDALMVSIRE